MGRPQAEPLSNTPPSVLNWFLLVIYFSDIYVAWSNIIANSLNKLVWGPPNLRGPRLQSVLAYRIIRSSLWQILWLVLTFRFGFRAINAAWISVNEFLHYGIQTIGFEFFGVFNATFSNISAISWRPVLVVEEAGVPGEKHRPWASNW